LRRYILCIVTLLFIFPHISQGLSPIESVVAMGDIGHTQLVIRTAQKVFYEIASDKSHQILTLSLYDIDPNSVIQPININTENTAIQNIQYNENDEHQFILTLNLAPNIEVQGLRIEGEGPSELILDMGLGSIPYIHPKIQDIKASGPYEPLTKTLEPLTPEEVAKENYNEALDLLAQDNVDGAALLLETVITQHPDFENARITLAEIYLKQNKSTQALSLLKSMSSQNPEFSTVLAEAYRQAGDANSAIKVYQALLKLSADNATWWAGLGMSYEMLKQNKEAREAFVKANKLGNLSPALQQYVSNQLAKEI
jgi:tetratricopeptide (TPR) repeat protein